MQPEVQKRLRSYLHSREEDSPSLFLSTRGLPLDRRTLWPLRGKDGKAAGVPQAKRKFPSLKHSLATHLLDADADLAFVKDWLGHANIQNTTIYAQLTSQARDQQARKLFASPRVV